MLAMLEMLKEFWLLLKPCDIFHFSPLWMLLRAMFSVNWGSLTKWLWLRKERGHTALRQTDNSVPNHWGRNSLHKPPELIMSGRQRGFTCTGS